MGNYFPLFTHINYKKSLEPQWVYQIILPTPTCLSTRYLPTEHQIHIPSLIHSNQMKCNFNKIAIICRMYAPCRQNSNSLCDTLIQTTQYFIQTADQCQIIQPLVWRRRKTAYLHCVVYSLKTESFLWPHHNRLWRYDIYTVFFNC